MTDIAGRPETKGERAARVVAGSFGSPAADDALEYEFADQLGDEGDEADELVERLLTRGAMAVLYGDSNSGKTFLAIDIGGGPRALGSTGWASARPTAASSSTSPPRRRRQ